MKIGIIGSGNMATALLSGFLSSNIVETENVYLSDTDKEKLACWKNKGVNCCTDNNLVAENSDIVIFAVKPNVLPKVLKDIKTSESKIYLSIAAGFSIDKIQGFLGDAAKVVRAMPNTPALVNCGMTVISANKNVTSEEKVLVKKLLCSVGEVVELEEKFINTATALHGSSPAYVYMFIDAMADSGVKHGLKKEDALLLAAKAVEGAAKMVLESDEHIMKLKDNVCSPGGTTIEAVLALEKGGFKSCVQKAIDDCIKKADNM